MDEVDPGLFLGNVEAAESGKYLSQKGITHILGVIHFQPDYPPLAGIKDTLLVRADDVYYADLLTHWEDTFHFIHTAISSQGKVLVHCVAGVSRSSATVIAYLMKKHGWTMDKALDIVTEKHSLTCPNLGFRKQLSLYGKMGCKLDTGNREYMNYVFRTLPSKPYLKKKSTFEDEDATLLEGFVQEDPELVAVRNTENAVYRCRMCRRMLFTGEMVVRHCRPFERNRRNHCERDSFQVTPLKWMPYQDVKGKLTCPKCNAKLGHFDWCGKECPCTAFVTPWFHIPQSKVDSPPSRDLRKTLQNKPAMKQKTVKTSRNPTSRK